MRLISNGSDTTGSGKGRVEIYYKDTWGTICDDHWDMDDATVVCKSLGFRLASRVAEPGEFGQGTGHIWMSNMKCNGTEDSLSQCFGTKYYPTTCVHEEDAGVVCAGGPSSMHSCKHVWISIVCTHYVSLCSACVHYGVRLR